MQVNLIYPRPTDTMQKLYANTPVMNMLKSILNLGEMNFTPPLSLLMLAAVTPPDVDVRFVDERLEEINFDAPTDLVGISVLTKVAPRAYRIADEYRRRGVRIVLGGVHASVMPDEASKHADAVVVGEGEIAWTHIIADYQQGALKPIYHGGHNADLSQLPHPRRDIIPQPEKYLTGKVVFASRGCPNGCAFCSAGTAVGKRYRTRPVPHVIEELNSLPGKSAYFADDNLGWDVAYTKSLLRALIPLKLHWAGELSLSALEDPELVELLAQSGCAVLGIGFESLSPQVLASIRKNQTNNPARYPELVRRLHHVGIPILGHFIVGFDGDDPSIFDALANFINQYCIEMPSIATLIPYPGAALYHQFEREGRILHKNWSLYDTIAGNLVYQPRQLDAQQLTNGHLKLAKELYSLRVAVDRIARAHTAFPMGAITAIHYNLTSSASARQDFQTIGAQRTQAVA